MSKIDWARMAVPQKDGYDTAELLMRCTQGRYAKVPPSANGDLVWGGGRARWATELTAHRIPDSSYTLLPTDDAMVRAGLQVLDLWPEVRDQSAALLHGVAPLTAAHRSTTRGQGHGCSCGHFGDDFGWIYVTADDAWGFAEGVVHEMAHWKLRALGIWFEDWTPDLLLHSFDELYTSPVRKDIARPMGAVLHAQYSYIHVARMVTLALEATAQPEVSDIEWAALQLSRITEGRGTLQQHARGTPDVGAPFLEAVDTWTEDVLTSGQAIVVAAQERLLSR